MDDTALHVVNHRVRPQQEQAREAGIAREHTRRHISGFFTVTPFLESTAARDSHASTPQKDGCFEW